LLDLNLAINTDYRLEKYIYTLNRDSTVMSDEMIKTLEEIVEAEKTMKTRFQSLAEKADTPEMRALFKELAAEEEGHERELGERLTALRLLRDG
jgi:rubrerythrin